MKTGSFRRANQRAFTLMEIMIGISITAVIATGIFVSVRPGDHMTSARDSERQAYSRELRNAIKQYALYTDGDLPEQITTTFKPICRYAPSQDESGSDHEGSSHDESDDESGCVDLPALVDGEVSVIGGIPQDVLAEGDVTGYEVKRACNGNVYVRYPGDDTVFPDFDDGRDCSLVAVTPGSSSSSSSGNHEPSSDEHPDSSSSVQSSSIQSSSTPTSTSSSSTPTSGTCNAANPNEICTCDQLQNNLRSNLDGNFELKANVDCAVTLGWHSGAGFEPIGSTTTPFTGTLNGNGFTIKDLTINRPTQDFVGLFSSTYDAVIKNLNLEGGYVKGDLAAGALVGSVSGEFTFENITTDVDVSAHMEVGGIFGLNTGTYGYTPGSRSRIVTDVHVSGDITSTGPFVGGISGHMFNGLIEKSSFTGTINSAATIVGGLVGDLFASQVTDSFVNATIVAQGLVGSIAGQTSPFYTHSSSIRNVYAAGTVTHNQQFAGATGFSAFGSGNPGTSVTLNNVFSVASVNGNAARGFGEPPSFDVFYNNVYWFNQPGDSASLCNGVNNAGCTIEDDISDFYVSTHPVYEQIAAIGASSQPWDFTTIWKTNAGGLPTLR